jgi:uncharacterized damage-inducible protein DinB
MKPEKGTYPPYFENYIPLVSEDNINEALIKNWEEIHKILSSVSPQLENYAYADKKWTIKQLVNHMIDTERIFTYRALRFARKDPQQPLPFEEDDYARHAEVSQRSLKDLLEEFDAVRKSTLCLFKSFSEPTLLEAGQTAGGRTTVVSLGYVICGHAIHHLNILKERYLKNNSPN